MRLANSTPIICAMHARPLIVRLRNWVGDVTLGLPTLQRLALAGYQRQLVGPVWARDLLAGHGWPVQTLRRSTAERACASCAICDAQECGRLRPPAQRRTVRLFPGVGDPAGSEPTRTDGLHVP